MPKVILTKGLPGSGKTTWAKSVINQQPGAYKRVNKDDLRAMLDDGHWGKRSEGFVLQVRNTIIQHALVNDLHVIVDDTNFNPIHEDDIRRLVHKINQDDQKSHWVEIKDFSDAPVETCIERDLKRPNSVGERVIRRMYNQYLKLPVKPPVHDPALPTAIICDLDGTLSLLNGRDPYDASTCDRDLCSEPVLETLLRFEEYLPSTGGGLQDRMILLVSGRMDTYRPQTEAFLNKHNVPYQHLWMRREGDTRKDFVVKQEIYERGIRGKYNVLFVLDDRNQVVDMWRALGLTVFQVAEGDF
ncbi:MAG: AAA family ATPase [Chloroflexota bacterium]|nr:AAA family ATPase [Chloroflexota bacterium]